MSEAHRWPAETPQVDARLGWICLLSALLALVSGGIAWLLQALIALITHLCFYGEVSISPVSPAGNTLGLAVVGVPVLGAIVVGLMARYGSPAIRGHGIPEAMEKILIDESRVPARMILLKPLSAAISIGTGGPFGAEGPIIATGGALGSFLGQRVSVSAQERKALLAAGAAAGMAATFGTPVSAVLLAVELLLFEYRPRSLLPVALAATVATGVRHALSGAGPVFPVSDLPPVGLEALGGYLLIGALVGLLAVGVTRLVYAVEDGFDRLPLHWMWWPALGAVAVGAIGWLEPRTLGVGYDNITDLVSGRLVGMAALTLVLAKCASWVVALGSGTSGGTLAPLLTLGAGAGSALGMAVAGLLPGLGLDLRMAALVGMAAMFAGASRALLASVVFAFEATAQTQGLPPLLGGCVAAYLVSCLLMRHSIMTEKIARRGTRVPVDYQADPLELALVRDHMSADPVTLSAEATLGSVRAWLAGHSPEAAHHGYPVLAEEDRLIGQVTRRALQDPALPDTARVGEVMRSPPVRISPEHTLRQAADALVASGEGRLVVVDRAAPQRVLGVLSRRDVFGAWPAHRRGAHGGVDRG